MIFYMIWNKRKKKVELARPDWAVLFALAIGLLVAGFRLWIAIPLAARPGPPISAWPQAGDFLAGRIIVELRAGEQFEPERLGLGKAQGLDESGRALATIALTGQDLDPADETLLALNRLLRNPAVKTAELDYRVLISLLPDDPGYTQQWYLPRIEAPAAWDRTIGQAEAIIAVVDTGIDGGHPDLAGKVRPGWDFVNDDADPTDDQGHGTHVAGVAGAATNNGLGVSGVCWLCQVLALKALDRNGSGGHYQIASAVRYAADHGARVINMSFGGPYTSATLRDAIIYAHQRGVLLVAAAGNAGGRQPQFPGAYGEVMAITATDAGDQLPLWANRGDWISLAAPGVAIWSTMRGGDYQAWAGTSMAAPQVAGAGGLLASAWPGATGDQIRAALEAGARDLGDPQMGAGLLDIAAALEAVPPSPTPTPSPGNGEEPSSTATATTAPTSTAIPSPTALPSAAADELVALINEERGRRGLHVLTVDARLVAAAERHAQDMRSNGFCGHAGSDGSSPEQRMREAGYTDPLFAIVACGYPDAAIVMAAILGCAAPGCGNPLPRDRVLSELAIDIGIFEIGGYWTINLGGAGPARPPTLTPTPMEIVTPTPTPTGFWLWCWGAPLRCEEQEP